MLFMFWGRRNLSWLTEGGKCRIAVFGGRRKLAWLAESGRCRLLCFKEGVNLPY